MNKIGIYPGNFQPPLLSNFKAYQSLKKVTGENTFITTTDLVELPKYPLNFQDKQQIWTRHGVSIDKIIKSNQPYQAGEVLKKFGTDRTIIIFAMEDDYASKFLRIQTGYYLPYNGNQNKLEPMDKHAYILIIPPTKSKTGDIIRRVFSSNTLAEEQKKIFFQQIFGWYDISLYELISKKFAEASTVKERVSVNENLEILRRTLKPFIKEVLGQLSTPQGQGTQSADVLSTEPAMTPAEIQKQKQDAQKQRDAQLKQKSVELQTAKTKRDFQKKEIDQANRYTVPNLNKDIQKLKGATF